MEFTINTKKLKTLLQAAVVAARGCGSGPSVALAVRGQHVEAHVVIAGAHLGMVSADVQKEGIILLTLAAARALQRHLPGKGEVTLTTMPESLRVKVFCATMDTVHNVPFVPGDESNLTAARPLDAEWFQITRDIAFALQSAFTTRAGQIFLWAKGDKCIAGSNYQAVVSDNPTRHHFNLNLSLWSKSARATLVEGAGIVVNGDTVTIRTRNGATMTAQRDASGISADAIKGLATKTPRSQIVYMDVDPEFVRFLEHVGPIGDDKPCSVTLLPFDGSVGVGVSFDDASIGAYFQSYVPWRGTTPIPFDPQLLKSALRFGTEWILPDCNTSPLLSRSVGERGIMLTMPLTRE